MARQTYFLGFFIFYVAISSVACIVKESQDYGTAKLSYCNPKHFSYCSVLTFPKVIKGAERLFTNFTFKNIVYVGNNFTVASFFLSQKGSQYKHESKFCEFTKRFWVRKFLKPHGLDKMPCPWPPGTVQFDNVEIPSPHMPPVRLVPGTYHMVGELFNTVSKERVAVLNYAIHFADLKKKNKKG